MSLSGGGGGKGGSGDLPGFGNVDLGPGLMATDTAMANRYKQLGLGGSTMEAQDLQSNEAHFGTDQAILNNDVAQEQFSDQIAQNNQNSGGFNLGLGSLAGVL